MKSVETINEKDFLEFYNSRTYTPNCFNDDGSLNKNYNSFKTTGVIASIFEDHWNFTYQTKKRDMRTHISVQLNDIFWLA